MLITHNTRNATRHTPPTTHRTLHTTRHAPQTTRDTPHTTHYTTTTTHHVPHMTKHTPHTNHYIAHTTHHTSHATHRTQHTIQYSPHTTHHTPHTTHRTRTVGLSNKQRMKRKMEQAEKEEAVVDSKEVKRAYAITVRMQVARRREPDQLTRNNSPSRQPCHLHPKAHYSRLTQQRHSLLATQPRLSTSHHTPTAT